MSGNKISIRKIWAIARIEWIKWICDPRMVIIPVLTVFIYSYAVLPLLERSEKMGEPLNMLEPLIAVGNSGILAMIIPVVFITLMSDFPRTDGSTIFMLSRTGRNNWTLGQMLFAAMSAVTYLAAVYVMCTAFLINKTFIANGWSMVVKRYDYLYPDEGGYFASELVPGNLHNQMTPFESVIQTYLFLFMYLLIIMLVMLFFRQIKHKGIGFLTAGGIIGFGVLFTSIYSKIMWIFPMANAIVWLHYTDIFRKEKVPMLYSYIYYGICIIVLITANITVSKKLNVDTIEEMEA